MRRGGGVGGLGVLGAPIAIVPRRNRALSGVSTRGRHARRPSALTGGRRLFVSTLAPVRLLVFVSGCSFLGVRLRRRTGRRPASGPDLASRLGLRGRGVHRFALDPPSSTCKKE